MEQYLLIKEKQGDSHEFTLLLNVSGVPKTQEVSHDELSRSTQAEIVERCWGNNDGSGGRHL